MSKQFIVDRHTTPGTPALDPVATAKVPVYDTAADADADLANLEVGQIIGIKDTGDELAQPVDVVEEDNLHAVTSNAVAESLINALDYTREEVDTGEYYYGTNIRYKVYKKNIYFDINTYSDTAGGRREFISENTLSADITTLINAEGYFRFAEPTTSDVYNRDYSFGSAQMQIDTACNLSSAVYFDRNTHKLCIRIHLKVSNLEVTKILGSIQIKYLKTAEVIGA